MLLFFDVVDRDVMSSGVAVFFKNDFKKEFRFVKIILIYRLFEYIE